MHALSIAIRKGVRGVVVAAALLAITSTAEAQTKLRWKFTPGEKVNYEMVMENVMEMNVGDKPLSSKTSQRIQTTWLVKEVAADGTAELTQTIDRIIMETSPPGVDATPVKYDSRNKEQDPGAAMFSPLFDAMLNQSFTMKVTPLGEVKDMQLPPALLEAMKKLGSPAMASIFSEDSLKQMMGRSMFTFPPELTKGQAWEAILELPNPILGKQIVTTNYVYAGPQQHDGRDVEKIDVSMEMKFDASPDAKVKVDITEQSGEGAIYFDNNQGLPQETNLTNKVTMAMAVGKQLFDQKLTTQVTMKQIVPDAKEAGDKE